MHNRRCPWCGKKITHLENGWRTILLIYHCKYCSHDYYYERRTFPVYVGSIIMLISPILYIISLFLFILFFLIGVGICFYGLSFIAQNFRCEIDEFNNINHLDFDLPIFKIQIFTSTKIPISKGKIFPLVTAFEESPCFSLVSPIVIRKKNRDGTFNVSFLYQHKYNIQIKNQEEFELYDADTVVGKAKICL